MSKKEKLTEEEQEERHKQKEKIQKIEEMMLNILEKLRNTKSVAIFEKDIIEYLAYENYVEVFDEMKDEFRGTGIGIKEGKSKDGNKLLIFRDARNIKKITVS